jgi:hypothetical protein
LKLTGRPELPAEFAFRIVEASGANVWYAALVEQGSSSVFAREIVTASNQIEPGSAAEAQVDSATSFEEALRAPACRIWVGSGFERFDHDAWSKLGRDRTRLEPQWTKGTRSEGVVVLVLDVEAYGALQAGAPNLASWIGGSVFEVAGESGQSPVDRERRLHELRRWADMTDDEVVRAAQTGSLRADPYFAEWLVLLGRGDLLGDT